MDKKINVKITADASGFDRAIKKAQKEIENFAKQGEKLGKSKFGKNTSKQFDSITKSTKKASKQFEGIEKNLESISKTKLTKLNKEFTKTEKSGKKLDKQLASSEKSLKSLVKTKFTNLTKQFSNMEKSSKKLDKQFESNEKTLKSISKIKLNDVTKQFDKIEKAADDVSDAVEDAADAFRKLERADLGGIDDNFKDITKQVDKVQDSVKDLSDTFKKLDGSVEDIDIDSFNNMNRDIDKLENNISSLSNSFRDLKNDISDIDKESLTNLTGDIDKIETNINRLSDKFSELRSDINKIDGMSLSGLTGDLSSVNNKINSVSDEFNDLNNEIDGINKQSFKQLASETSSLGESAGTLVDSFTSVGKSLGDIAAGKLGDLSGKLSIANSDFIRLGTSMTGTTSQMLLTGSAVTSISKAINGLKTDRLKMLETNASNLNATMIRAEAELSRLDAQMKMTASDIIFQEDTIQELRREYDKLNDKYIEAADKADLYKMALGEQSEQYQEAKKKADDYKNELTDLSQQIEEAEQGLADLEQQQYENNKTMDKFKNHVRDLKAELDMVKSEIDAYGGSTKKASDSQKKLADSAKKTAKSQKESADAMKDSADAAEDAADAYDDLADSQDDAGDSAKKLGDTLKKFKDIFDKLKSGNFKDAFNSFKGIGDDLFKNLGKGISDAGSKLAEFGGKLAESGGLIGKLGNVLSKAGGAMSSFGASIAAAAGEITAVVAAVVAATLAINKLYESGKRQFFEGLSNIKDKFQPIINAAKSLGQEIKSAFENITGIDLDLSSAISSVVEFESSIVRANAIARGNEKTLLELEQTARQFGATTRYSAIQVADAMNYMGMAGWSTRDIMDGLEGVLNLATIGCIDLGQASDFVTDGLTALGMSASQSNDFVDMLAATITRSNTNVEQMQEAFTNVAPIAGTLNISMSDLSVTLGAMADNGVKGAKAGTALKNLLTNLVEPTDKVAACISKYNLEAARQMIINGDLIGGIKEMKNQIEDLDASTQANIITTIAGKEALSGVAALMNTSTTRLNELKFAVDSSTKANRLYAESLGLIDDEGNVLIDDFDNMTDAQKKSYEQWENYNQVMQECADTMTLVGGSSTELSAIVAKLGEDNEVTAEQVNKVLDVFNKMKKDDKEVVDTLKEYGIEIGKADDGTFDFGETLKNVGKVWDNLSDSEKQALANQLGLGDSVKLLDELYSNNGKTIEDWLDGMEKAQGVAEHLAKTFDGTLKGAILKLGSAISERLLQVFDKLKPAIQGVTETLGTFFDIWNGMSDKFKGKKGFGNAIKYLEKESRSWGKSLEKGIIGAVKGINKFVNGDGLKNVLKIGTNIIGGICDGIDKAKKNKSLDQSIDGIITNACDWINTNGPKIEKAGKTLIDSVSDGIKNNKEAIGEALDTVMDVLTTWGDSTGNLKSQKGNFASKFIGFALDQAWIGVKNWAKEKLRATGDLLGGFLKNIASPFGRVKTTGKLIDGLCEAMFGKTPIADAKKWVEGKFKDFHPLEWIKDHLFGNKKGKVTSKGQDSGNTLKLEDIIGKIPTPGECKDWIESKLSDFHPIQWAKDCLFGTAYAAEVGGGKGGDKNKVKPEQLFNLPSLDECKKWVQDKVGDWHPIQWIKDKLFKGKTTSKAQDSGNSPIKPEQLIKLPSVGDIKSWIESKISNWHPIQWIKDKLFKGKTTSKSQDSGNSAIKPEQLIKLPSMGEFKSWVQSKISGWHPIQWIKEKLFGKGGTTSKAQDSGNSAIKPEQLIKLPSIGDIKSFIDSKLGDFHPMKWIAEKWNKKVDVPTTAFDWISDLIPDDLGTKLSDKLTSVLGENWFTDTISKIFGGGKDKGDSKADVSDLLKIDTEKLENVKKTLEELGTVATNQAQIIQTAFSTIQEGATTSLTGMVDSARTSFVGLYNIVNNQFMNMNEVIRTSMVNCADIVRNQAVNMANIFRNQFVNMANIARNQFVNVANIVRNQMVNSCNIVRNQCVNMANIFRNQFVSMANVARNQMVNVSNIVRNQAVAWSNIIRNQCQNARNALTSSMLSMAAVARTQMVNITNIVRNQAVAWANIVRSQSANMRGAMSSAFSGLAAVAARGMAACLATVRSYMAQIRAATAQTMTMNFRVNKTVTTTNVTKNVTQGAGPKSLYNASSAIYSAGAMASTPSVYGNTQALARSASTVASSGSRGSNVSQKDHVTIEIPVNLDGKQIAKVSAKYMDGELSKINNRSNRKRGIA